MKKWCGYSDSKTSLMYFGFEGNHPDHKKEFDLLLEKMMELEKIGALQFAYIDNESPDKHVVAYRFVSDRSHNAHFSSLLNLGGGLGRGCWCPFTDDATYNMFLK